MIGAMVEEAEERRAPWGPEPEREDRPEREDKSASQELADGLGSLFRAAKKAVAAADPSRLEAIGKKAMRELDSERLSELGRKAVEQVERFDPQRLGMADILSAVEKAVDRVETFVKTGGRTSDPAPDAEAGFRAEAGQDAGGFETVAAEAPPRPTGPSSSREDGEGGAKWRLRVDD